MFDTKNYYNPLEYHCYYCHCRNEFCGKTHIGCHITPLHQSVIEKNIYTKGYFDGMKETEERLKIRFKTPDEHELMVKKLKECMKPLEDLLKEINI